MKATQVKRVKASSTSAPALIPAPRTKPDADEVVLNRLYPEDGYVNTSIKRRAALVQEALQGWIDANPNASTSAYRAAELSIVGRIEASLVKHKDLRNEKTTALRFKDIEHRFNGECLVAMKVDILEPGTGPMGIPEEVLDTADNFIRGLFPDAVLPERKCEHVQRSSMILCQINHEDQAILVSAAIQNPKDEFVPLLGMELALSRMDAGETLEVPITRQILLHGLASIDAEEVVRKYAKEVLKIKI